MKAALSVLSSSKQHILKIDISSERDKPSLKEPINRSKNSSKITREYIVYRR